MKMSLLEMESSQAGFTDNGSDGLILTLMQLCILSLQLRRQVASIKVFTQGHQTSANGSVLWIDSVQYSAHWVQVWLYALLWLLPASLAVQRRIPGWSGNQGWKALRRSPCPAAVQWLRDRRYHPYVSVQRGGNKKLEGAITSQPA